ncbi:CG31142, partial [Drosophila busckii]
MSQACSSDDESDFKAVSKANRRKITKKVAKISYADGVADGQKRVFQPSFDLGYRDGIKTGIGLTKHRAFFDTLATSQIKDDVLIKERVVYEELQIDKATAEHHQKRLELLNESLTTVSEKQKAYVDEILGDFSQKLPTATNLL